MTDRATNEIEGGNQQLQTIPERKGKLLGPYAKRTTNGRDLNPAFWVRATQNTS